MNRNFRARANVEDRQMVQYNGDVINLSGQTNFHLGDYNGYIYNSYEDFINGVSGGPYNNVPSELSDNFLSGWTSQPVLTPGIIRINPPRKVTFSGNTDIILSGETEDVTGYVATSIDSFGTVGWVPQNTEPPMSCFDTLETNTIKPCGSNNVITIEGDLLIKGVTSGTTIIETEIVRVEDNNLELNFGGNHSTSVGGGITVLDGQSDGVDSSIKTNSSGEWVFTPPLNFSGITGTLWESGVGLNSLVTKNSFNVASGDYSLSEGTGNLSSGDYSHAEGFETVASGDSSHSEGVDTLAQGGASHAEGSQTQAIGDGGSHAEGSQSIAIGVSSHAEGFVTISVGDASHAEGWGSQSVGGASHSEGYFTVSSGLTSHAEGEFTKSVGQASHAEGSSSIAFGGFSHAEGDSTIASGLTSHAEGALTLSIGDVSHAEGFNTIASGDYSHSEGQNTQSIGEASHAEGFGTTSSGYRSHAEGSNTTSSGGYSHSEGSGTEASGEFGSHAEGYITLASGDFGSHAEGSGTEASGQSSHAEGTNTKANGNSSHSEGFLTESNGQSSHAGGYNSIVESDYGFIHSRNSTLTSGATSSVLLGGVNLTGTEPNTVYVPKLNVNDVGTTTSVNNLGVDVDGNIVISEPILIEKKVLISSSDFKNINSTPYELIPSPGVGKVVDIVSAISVFSGGTTPYGNSGYISVQYSSTSSSIFGSIYSSPSSFNVGSQFNSFIGDWIGDGSTTSVSNGSGPLKLLPSHNLNGSGDEGFVENDPIVLWGSTDNTVGDVDMVMYLTYKIVTI